ncbi:cyclic nucleotide-binding domain-containing protein [archaeon]|nr:MAG: cyclic nucleotide-binding domain-containing protein [archaeon]
MYVHRTLSGAAPGHPNPTPSPTATRVGRDLHKRQGSAGSDKKEGGTGTTGTTSASSSSPAEFTMSQLSFLKSVPLFHSFSEDKFYRLAQKLQRVVFEPSGIILRQGDPPDGFFYIIESGRVSIHVKKAGPTTAAHATASARTISGRASTRTRLGSVSQSASSLGSPAGGTCVTPQPPGSPSASMSDSPQSSAMRSPLHRVQRMDSTTSSVDDATFQLGTPSGSVGTSDEGGRPRSAPNSGAGGGSGSDASDEFMMEDVEDERSVEMLGPVVAELSKGMFFGERALMTSEPRAATCVAASRVVCYALDRRGFEDVRIMHAAMRTMRVRARSLARTRRCCTHPSRACCFALPPPARRCCPT